MKEKPKKRGSPKEMNLTLAKLKQLIKEEMVREELQKARVSIPHGEYEGKISRMRGDPKYCIVRH